MNVRKFTRTILAAALIVSSAHIIAAEQSDLSGPYTGPDSAVLTTAQNDKFIGIEGGSVVAVVDTISSARPIARFGSCGTLTFSSNGNDTAISSNQFADPFASGDTSFVCHTY